MSGNRLVSAVLLAGSLLALAIAAASLEWRMVHDVPEFVYHGFLMARLGLVPYRDFWDVNAPGTELLHYALVATLGPSDLAVRIVDLGMLAVTAGATFAGMRRFGALPAWCAAVLWSLVYLGLGPRSAFQRDEMVACVASIGLCVTSLSRWPAARRALVLGLVFGIAATIKPPSAVGLPVLLAFDLLAERERTRQPPLRLALRSLGFAAAGFVLAPLAAFSYLLWNGAWDPFREVAERYWPLYVRLSGTLATIQSPPFNQYSGYRVFNRMQPWLVPAAFGALLAWQAGRPSVRRRDVLLLVSLALAFLLYVGLQGKFFAYHWHPFLYCLVLLSSLACVELERLARPLRALPPLLLLAFVFWRVAPPGEFALSLQRQPLAAPKGGRVDEIAAFLKAQLRPGDTVQPLDLTGGVLHGMLLAEARPATPYLYDHVFYHHVSENYIADVRGRFLLALREARPRFVIEVPGDDKPWVRGKDTTREFNKLRRYLAENYAAVRDQNGYVIYERRE